MDGHRFDDLTRKLAVRGSRRGMLTGLVAIVASRSRSGAAACPQGQFARRGVGCVCRSTGRPPSSSGGPCPCPNGLERCGGVCVRRDRDPAHCGECGRVCPAERPFCVGGACVACRWNAECDDGIGCTVDTCRAGACHNDPNDAVCDDGDPCTINHCDAVAGCVSSPERLGVPCGDGLFCNGMEVCDGAGHCQAGSPVECGPCLTCREATENCEPDPAQDGLSCGDGGQVCAAGTCACPEGMRECSGTCRECCSSADCPTERPSCLSGTCGCKGSGFPCTNSAECCPTHQCSSGFCCLRSGQRCVSGEPCCSRGCDFDTALGFRVCG
jgi:hypothetical protein